MNVIIPLAGLGERFQRDGYTTPKPLIPVMDKPILFHVLDSIQLRPDDKLFILYNSALKEHDFCNIVASKYPNACLIEMPSTRGAAETICLGIDKILSGGYTYNKQCVLMDCDTFYTDNVLSYIRASAHKNAVYYTKNTETQPLYSYIELNADGFITDIREKEKISDCANTGIYCFAELSELHTFCRRVIENDIRFRGEFYTSCVIAEMIKAGALFCGIELDASTVISLGTPAQVRNYVARTHAFLFDLDGTIVQSDHVYFDVWKDILRDHGIILTHDIFDKYIRGNSDSHVQRTLLPHDTTPISNLSARKDDLTIQYIHRVTEVAGAIAFIQSVRSRGHKVAIVTNCNRNVAEAIMQHIRVEQYIDLLVIGGECAKPKPYADPYMAAMNHFKLPSDRCFVFEDSKTGILSGSGIQPKCIVGIETNYTANDLVQSGAQLTYKDMTSITVEGLLAFSNNTFDTLSSYVRDTLMTARKSPTTISWMPAKLKGGYISDVLAVCVGIEGGEPLSCVLKLENQTESYLSNMANKLGLYEREYYFYEAISKYVNIGIPAFYGLVKTPNFKNVGILLGNLNATCDLALDLNKESVDVSLKVIDSCAKLHAKFWNVALEDSFPLLKKNNDASFRPVWSDYVSKQWSAFRDKWAFMMSEKQLRLFESIVADFSDIQAHLSNTNLTLIHGDVKSGNIFYGKTDRTPYFLDWQYVAIGKGVQDLVFFMIESFDTHTMDKYFQTFKQYYYIKLLEYGVRNYAFEEYEKDFEYAAKYCPFFVAIWFGTTPEDDLIDKNFPYFFIQKLLHFLDYTF